MGYRQLSRGFDYLNKQVNGITDYISGTIKKALSDINRLYETTEDHYKRIVAHREFIINAEKRLDEHWKRMNTIEKTISSVGDSFREFKEYPEIIEQMLIDIANTKLGVVTAILGREVRGNKNLFNLTIEAKRRGFFDRPFTVCGLDGEKIYAEYRHTGSLCDIEEKDGIRYKIPALNLVNDKEINVVIYDNGVWAEVDEDEDLKNWKRWMDTKDKVAQLTLELNNLKEQLKKENVI